MVTAGKLVGPAEEKGVVGWRGRCEEGPVHSSSEYVSGWSFHCLAHVDMLVPTTQAVTNCNYVCAKAPLEFTCCRLSSPLE